LQLTLGNFRQTKAENNIGSMYGKGEGVPQSDEQAFQWYLKAAQANDPTAQYNVAMAYQHGTVGGATANYEEAAK
jgi:uncharacterized protein